MGDRLDLYRTQHRDLLAVAGALEALLGPGALPHGAARALVARLAGKLSVHLRMEDQGLYPELRGHADGAVREAAARFQEGMGGIREAADAFFRRWLGPGAIERAPHRFAEELRPLLEALTGRIAAEDAQLFPLAERLDGAGQAAGPGAPPVA